MTVARIVQCRISAAVDHDVVFVGDDGREIQILLDFEQDARAGGGMLVHEGSLFVRQLPRLREYLERNLDLADVVQQTRDPECPHVGRGKAEELGQRHRQHGNVHRVRGRVLIELLELQQRQHDLPAAMHRDRQ